MTAAVLLGAAVVSCDAGQDAATQSEVPDVPGVDASIGSIELVDVYLDTAVAVPAGGDVDATTGPVRVRLTSLTDALPVEGTVQVTFQFAVAGRGDVEVPTGTPQWTTLSPDRAPAAPCTASVG